MLRDLRFAFRLLLKSPTFAAVSVLTLALCIGANTAVYSVVDAALFRPLPYPSPDRLASVVTRQRGPGVSADKTEQDGRSWQFLHQNAKLVDLAAFSEAAEGINLFYESGARYVQQQRVSADFFRVLGVPLFLGHAFTRKDDVTGGPPVAVLSNALWKQAFRSDAKIIGQKITLRGEPYTVTGVMPPNFESSVRADLWTPLRPSTSGEGSGTNYLLVARLHPGISWTKANSEASRIGASVFGERHLPPGYSAQLQLVPLKAGMTAGIRSPLLILWAAVGMVLLIGCVNIASLLLARSALRSREIATRLSLGSSKSAIVGQLLAESFLLAIAGGIAGIALGFVALHGLAILNLEALGIHSESISLDGRVLTASAIIAVATTFIFGLYPALHATKVDILSTLTHAGSRAFSGKHQSWSRRFLLVAQVALAVVVLITAGLLLRTFAHLISLPPGFNGNHVLTASLSLRDARYVSGEKTNQLFERSLGNIRQVPGIEAAGVGLTMPYKRGLNDGFMRLDGLHPSSEQEITDVTYVTPGYFEALRTPHLQGRSFDERDTAQAQPSAVVNQAFALRYLHNQNAVGSHLNAVNAKREVIGVIGDMQQAAAWGNFGPLAPVPTIYVPASQVPGGYFALIHTWFSPFWVVRTSLPREAATSELQRAIKAVDPQLPFSEFKSIDEIRTESVAFQRVTATLLGILAALALFLTSLGVYGLIANAVVERTRELGIRLALGATVTQAIRTASMPGVTLTAIGLLVGCVAALGSVRLLNSLLWGVKPTDPVTFAGVCTLLLFVAAVASLLSGLRVASIDPARSLRDE